jgi:hypothetical protein
MEDRQFDALVKQLSQTRLSRLAVLRGMTAGAATALTGMILSPAESAAKVRRRKRRRRRDRKRDKVTLCHCPSKTLGTCQTIKVSSSAVVGHLAHGDFLGACEDFTVPALPQGATCTPLLQACAPTWLGGHPCCDAKAVCMPTNDTVPFAACVDATARPVPPWNDELEGECTSDAFCQANFSDPNIACLPTTLLTCDYRTKTSCCQRKTCPRGQGCAGGVACCLALADFEEHCCASGQSCTAAGCAL